MITNEPTTEPVIAPVELTDAAAAKVKRLIDPEADPVPALRLAIKPGGCSGFTYDLFFDDEIDETDLMSEKDGVKIVVDVASAPHVAGAVVDYQDMGLQGGGFAINNPNQQRSCGCGQSFC